MQGHGHVRSLDNKTPTGAVVQQWKETLREDFARDADNFESKEMLANLAKLSKIMNARKGDDDDE